MKKSDIERLKVWVDSLDKEQLRKIVLETVEFCVDSEEVSFYSSTTSPYWSNSGERLDGLQNDIDYDDDF